MEGINGVSIIAGIKGLNKIPKIGNFLNFVINVEDEKDGYDLMKVLQNEVALSPFFLEYLLLPELIFSFIKESVGSKLNASESELLDKLIKLTNDLGSPVNYDKLLVGSREEYIFRKDLISLLKSYKSIPESTLFKDTFLRLLNWKKDADFVERVNKITGYKLVYKRNWDFLFRAIFLFCLYSQEELETMLDSYSKSEVMNTNFSKNSAPTLGFEKYLKDNTNAPEIDVCRVTIYEEVHKLNFIFPSKVLKRLNIPTSDASEFKQEAKQGENIRENILSFFDIRKQLEGQLGFMGVDIEAYNKFRVSIGLKELVIKYYIIDDSGNTEKETDSFEDIKKYIQDNNRSIMSITNVSSRREGNIEPVIKNMIESENSLIEISSTLGIPEKTLLHGIAKGNLASKMFEVIQEEESLEVTIKDSESFFYKTSIPEYQIVTYIQELKERFVTKKSVKQVKVTYVMIKDAREQLLGGSSFKRTATYLRGRYNITIDDKQLKEEIHTFFEDDEEQIRINIALAEKKKNKWGIR